MAAPGHIDENLECYSPTDDELGALEVLKHDHPDLGELRPGMVLRFLRSRGLDIGMTVQMLRDHLAWRQSIDPDGIQVNAGSGLQRCDLSGFWRYLHTTPGGVPVVYCAVGLWNPHEYTIDEYEQFGALQAVRTEAIMSRTGCSKHIAIVDLSGWALWHGNYLSYQKRLAAIAQNHYPERVSSVIMLNAPYLFSAAWGVISPFLGENTTSKVRFVTNEQAKVIYEELGVDASIVARWAEMPVPGWPDE